MEKALAITIGLPTTLKSQVKTLQDEFFEKRFIQDPHITLYLCKFPARNFKKVVATLETVPLSDFEIKVGSIAIDPSKNGKLFYYYKIVGPEIHTLHKKILKVCNLYRDGLIRTKDKNRIARGDYTKREMSRLEKYGYTQVLGYLNPHITLGDSVMLSKKAKQSFEKKAKKLIGQTFQVGIVYACLYDFDNTQNSYHRLKKEIIDLK